MMFYRYYLVCKEAGDKTCYDGQCYTHNTEIHPDCDDTNHRTWTVYQTESSIVIICQNVINMKIKLLM